MGKVQDLIDHPEEFWPLVRLYRAAKRAKSQTHQDPDLDFCYSMLNLVSRR